MGVHTLLADPTALKLEYIRTAEDEITMVVTTISPSAECPHCHSTSSRIHSRYRRNTADLPWQGVAVRLELHTRRFFCDHPECSQRIFCERLPTVVAPYARRTIRLHEALHIIGFAVGGEPGARTAVRLGLSVSPDTLLRRIRHAALPLCSTPRVLGVDDWAFRRGKRSGTILVDLEQRRPVDLLPDREADTLAAWLEAHPGVEIISRDRSGAYAEGASRGAPLAVQVADRWHLLKNLVEMVERLLTRHHQRLRQAGEILMQVQLSTASSVIEAGPLAMLSSHHEPESDQHRQVRYERYTEVMKQYRKGLSIRSIARSLHMSRMTVYKYIRADGFPERARTRRRGSPLDRFIPYLHQRWAEGCHNITQLWREIVEHGYRGQPAMVRRYMQRLKARLSVLSPTEQARLLHAETNFQVPSSRRAAWWLLSESEELTTQEQTFVAQLQRLCPEIAQAQHLACQFQTIVRDQQPDRFDLWLQLADQCQIPELKGFADQLKKDRAAVIAALHYPWSNGQTEGQVNRLKTIKRQMYGRANFDLLRARVLNAA